MYKNYLKFVRSMLSVVLSFVMISICSNNSVFYAKDVEYDSTGLDSIIYETGEWEDNIVSYENVNGDEYVPEFKNLNSTNLDLPSKYDSRDHNYVTPVRNQGSFGFCWSFGSTASIESSMLANKLTDKSQEDLYISEVGQAYLSTTKSNDPKSLYYYDYNKIFDKGYNGGFPEYVAEAMANGLGPYESELLPYSQVTDGYNEQLRYYSLARLKTYENYRLSYGFNDAVLKNAIISNGGAAFFMTTTGYWQGENKKYYYDNGNIIQEGQNHVVEVIGWDDDFDKSNFNPNDPTNQPLHNGAWIIKNSWGTDFGFDGFQYVSYDSVSLEFYTFVVQDLEAYDNVYQYSNTAQCYVEGSIANVYTSNRNETLEQIAFMNLNETSGKIEIYKLDNNYTSPKDGELISEQAFSFDTTGIHSVEIKNKIELSKNDIYSVVVNASKGFIACSAKNNNKLNIRNVGFYSDDKIHYIDVLDEKNYDLSYPYIKAYTKSSEKPNKEKLIASISEYENKDTTYCKDQSLLQKYDKEAQKAYSMLNDDAKTQNEINNQVYLLNYYHSLCCDIYNINSNDDLVCYYNNCKEKNWVPKTIILNSDLDLNGLEFDYSITHTNTFSGTFIGNNYTISDLKINIDSNLFQSSGLFSKIKDATISDVKVSNATILGNSSFGGIAGDVVENCSISNCEVSNSTVCSTIVSQSAGGIVGSISLKNCSINNCVSKNNIIKSNSSSSGIVGYISPIASEYSISSCTVSNNFIKSFCNVSETFPNDENALSVYAKMSPECKIYCNPFVTIQDRSAYIEEFTGKIENVTNAQYGDNKWNVIGTKGLITCLVNYSENYNGIFSTNFNMVDDTHSIVYISGGESLHDIVIPNHIGKYPVVSIEKSALEDYTYSKNVTSIKIEDGVKTSDIKFTNFAALENIEIGEGTTDIAELAFYNLTSIKNVKLPDSLIEIENSAFQNCSLLENIEFGNGVEVIGISSFLNCISLKSIKLPDSILKISQGAFEGCLPCKIMLGKNISSIEANALGFLYKYLYDDNGKNPKPLKIDHFVINGYTDAAKKYAKENGFEYVDLNSQKPDIDDTMFDMSIFKAGDVDLDKKITIIDTTKIQLYLANLQSMSDYQKYNMRVKGCETTVSIKNATIIQEYLANIIDSLDY